MVWALVHDDEPALVTQQLELPHDHDLGRQGAIAVDAAPAGAVAHHGALDVHLVSDLLQIDDQE